MVLCEERRYCPLVRLHRTPDRGGAVDVGVGTPKKEKKRLCDHLDAIALLKCNSLRRAGVIGVYHVRKVALLMARALPLYEMVPDTWLDGMVVAQGTLYEHSTSKR
jgi:hypothetical protein